MWLEGPRSIGAKFGGYSKFAKNGLRFGIARDDERILYVCRAHFFNERVHVTRFGAIPDGDLVFRGSETERANHHGGQCVCEFALEHRAFACDHAVILASLAVEKRRENVGQKNLPGSFEIAACAIKALRHHAEVNVFGAEHVANLSDHFVHTDIRARVTSAVIAGKKQTQLFAGRPARSSAKHPLQARQFEERADPPPQKTVCHAAGLPLALRAAPSI